jgi:hypothetical protein
MAKTILKIDEEDRYDFYLFGIASQARDYLLCHAVNLKLEISLVRQEDFDIFNQKRMEEQGFAFFRYDSEDDDQICLVSNRSPKGLLIPEQKQMDYFLMIRPVKMRVEESSIIDQLKQTPVILGVYKLNVMGLKSRANLVF